MVFNVFSCFHISSICRMDFLSFLDSRYVVKHTHISVCKGQCLYLKAHSRLKVNFFCPQGFSYFLPPFGFPQQRNNVVLQPNNGQQTLERTTQRPQLPLQVRHARWHWWRKDVSSVFERTLRRKNSHFRLQSIYYKSYLKWIMNDIITAFENIWNSIFICYKLFWIYKITI